MALVYRNIGIPEEIITALGGKTVIDLFKNTLQLEYDLYLATERQQLYDDLNNQRAADVQAIIDQITVT
jgi:hypothetical protein